MMPPIIIILLLLLAALAVLVILAQRFPIHLTGEQAQTLSHWAMILIALMLVLGLVKLLLG